MRPFDPSCIDVFDYFECLEVDNVTQATDSEVRYSCPYPGHAMGDSTPSAYMNIETTAFFCHACHAKGNAVHLASEILGVSMLEATKMLKQRYSPSGLDPDSRNMREELKKYREKKQKPPPPENVPLDESIIDQFAVDWFAVEKAMNMGQDCPPCLTYMISRGFGPETLEEWQFGYDHKSDRIVFPVRDENGVLVGFKARAWDKRKNKYLNLGKPLHDFNPFLKNNVVFALDRARKVNEQFRHLSRELIIVEGELNAISMHRYGWTNTVAINGSYFGQRQIKLLTRYADRAILFFDSDEAGYDATRAVIRELRPFMPVYICPDHDGDPADMDFEEIKACIDQAVSSVRLALLRSGKIPTTTGL
jgi:DNA primase